MKTKYNTENLKLIRENPQEALRKINQLPIIASKAPNISTSIYRP